MAQGKQAKILTETQIKVCLLKMEKTRNEKRDRVIFLLSIKAGLRAKEIACLTWGMVTDAEGQVSDCIHLEDIASKGKGGRTIPMHRDLIAALVALKAETKAEPWDRVVYSERGDAMRPNSIVNWFAEFYRSLGFDGCSSHSGRRTFITNVARKVSLVGASLRDVQQMAGHSSLATTQRYVEGDSEAKRKLIGLI